MFCLGMSAMLAQIVMTRELMVAFYGTELAIGIIFAVWLLMVSAGSLVIRPFLSRLSENGIRSIITVLLVIFAIILPLLIFAPRAAARKIAWLAAIVLTALLIFPGPIKALENKGLRLRWESFGVLPRGVQHFNGNARLIDSRDSRYQNLALIKSEGQQTLYGNGQVMFVFPDKISAERKIHFIMAQKPSARKILFIGGNPVSDIPELLKYPLKKLVHVELDPLINRMLAENAGADYQQAMRDQQASCPGRFLLHGG